MSEKNANNPDFMVFGNYCHLEDHFSVLVGVFLSVSRLSSPGLLVICVFGD